MALTQLTGFNGTWDEAGLQQGARNQSGYHTATGFALTPSSLSLTVGTGTLWAFGGCWRLLTPETLTVAAAPTSGWRRDYLCVRLDYAADTATLVLLTNGSDNSPNVPASREKTFGAKYDLPIGYITMTAGQTIPEVYHLTSGKVERILAPSTDVIIDPWPGLEVETPTGVVYRFTSQANAWVELATSDTTVTFTTTSPAGAGGYRVHDRLCEVWWTSRGNVAAGDSVTPYTLPSTVRPSQIVAAAVGGGVGRDRPAAGSISTSGLLTVRNNSTKAVPVSMSAVYLLPAV